MDYAKASRLQGRWALAVDDKGARHCCIAMEHVRYRFHNRRWIFLGVLLVIVQNERWHKEGEHPDILVYLQVSRSESAKELHLIPPCC